MAEEKKPKIDLKARLGKAGAGAAGGTPAPIPDPRGSVPPPAIPVPILPGPRGSVPPPVVTPGIPIPPFAQPRRSTFGPPEPAPPPKPQDIKIEVGVEAVEAQKKNRKFIGVALGVGVVLGIAVGFNFGSNSEAGRRENISISGAADLGKAVDESNAKIKLLGEKIKAAGDSLKQRKFPDAFASDLGALNIPFDGDKLAGKGIGGYDKATLDLVFSYSADVAALNARKDALKSLFTGQKKAIIETLEAGEKPQLRYTLLVLKGEKGPVGSLAPISEPFALGADWPKEFKMQNLITKEVQTVNRYESGDLFTTKDKRIGIPIEPTSLSAAFPNDISGRVLSELAKTGQLLGGGGGEDDERAGLVKTGELLSEALKKIAAKKK